MTLRLSGSLPIMLVLALCLPEWAGADSDSHAMTVFGGDRRAHECFDSAAMAARLVKVDPDAVAVCTSALKFSKLSERDRMATLVNRGILHMSQRDLDAAAADYAAAIEINPQSPEVYVDRGNLLFLRRDYAGAIADYTQALGLGLKKDFIAYTNRALAHEHLRDFVSARADFERAVERAPDWYLPRAKLDALVEFGLDQNIEQN